MEPSLHRTGPRVRETNTCFDKFIFWTAVVDLRPFGVLATKWKVVKSGELTFYPNYLQNEVSYFTRV